MRYFNPNEFADYSKMDLEFLEFLEELRKAFGKPIRINSSYRDPDHNESVGGVSKSAHTEIPCRAADIHCGSSSDRQKLMDIARGMGCTRIGIGETFLHFDFSKSKPQNVTWDYYK